MYYFATCEESADTPIRPLLLANRQRSTIHRGAVIGDKQEPVNGQNVRFRVYDGHRAGAYDVFGLRRRCDSALPKPALPTPGLFVLFINICKYSTVDDRF